MEANRRKPEPGSYQTGQYWLACQALNVAPGPDDPGCTLLERACELRRLLLMLRDYLGGTLSRTDLEAQFVPLLAAIHQTDTDLPPEDEPIGPHLEHLIRSVDARRYGGGPPDHDWTVKLIEDYYRLIEAGLELGPDGWRRRKQLPEPKVKDQG